MAGVAAAEVGQMVKMNVKQICEAWVKDGLEEECFWEGWPDCPTPDDTLTPGMVLRAITDLEESVHNLQVMMNIFESRSDD